MFDEAMLRANERIAESYKVVEAAGEVSRQRAEDEARAKRQDWWTFLWNTFMAG